MKKILFLFGVALAITACSSDSEPNYSIEFNATSKNNDKTVFLTDFDNDDKVDSAIVVNGKAVFSGKTDAPRLARIMIGKKRGPIFILEQGNITINEHGTASGSPLNEAFERYNFVSDSLQKEYVKVARNEETKDLATSIKEQYLNLERETRITNQGNPIGYYLFLQQAYELEPAQLDSAIAADTTLLQYSKIEKLVEAAERKRATSEGNVFTDFEIEYDGKVQKLSDYVGKGDYAIVDFWASWCGPCMREAETLKTIYKKWGGKGLEIVGVAVWDEPANTLKAIEDKGLVWKHIINGQSKPTDLYGISGIPCIVIVDPEGNIIGRDIRGEELVKFIDEKLEAKK